MWKSWGGTWQHPVPRSCRHQLVKALVKAAVARSSWLQNHTQAAAYSYMKSMPTQNKQLNKLPGRNQSRLCCKNTKTAPTGCYQTHHTHTIRHTGTAGQIAQKEQEYVYAIRLGTAAVSCMPTAEHVVRILTQAPTIHSKPSHSRN